MLFTDILCTHETFIQQPPESCQKTIQKMTKTESAVIVKKASEGDWPEPARVIALIHQNIDQGNMHWFSEALIRKPQAHRSEEE